jgi:hypothetical protein
MSTKLKLAPNQPIGLQRQTNQLIGRWRITEMPDFDDEYPDEETKAFIRFDADGMGQFHFGYVHGMMDCQATTRDGKPAVEWSWDGNDEHHDAMGRGWAVLEEDGTLSGVVHFHLGDKFSFRAKKWPEKKGKTKC